MTPSTQTNGFPAGYFVIRSLATDRLLDVTQDEIEDGTDIILWPEKETSLVESLWTSNHQIPRFVHTQYIYLQLAGILKQTTRLVSPLL
jgi:hypothetical protein